MERPAGRQQQPGLGFRGLASESGLRQRRSDAAECWARLGGLEAAAVRLSKLFSNSKCSTFTKIMEA
eukprot:14779892-Heterocapsa_arctica.AAC.1